ncbi:MAG: succinate dehydrogenase iron-sulfur subunit, partial [Rhodospirillales bacterium]|nr:succinate dehydrogenase iron-sulfur subunit [Rhodospirillales bacterium]
MVEFNLPAGSKPVKGKEYPAPDGAKQVKAFRIYRYDPDGDANP